MALINRIITVINSLCWPGGMPGPHSRFIVAIKEDPYLMSIKLSCEFYPPKTEKGVEKLLQTAKILSTLNPEFFSMTCGALGTDRHKSIAIINALLAHVNTPITPHLTCIGTTKNEIRQTLKLYQSKNIRQILALRGDIPKEDAHIPSDFHYANELITFIRDEFGDYFRICVGAYPETHPDARNPEDDLQNFKRKVDAGADCAITQFFFNAETYTSFVAKCRAIGIRIPIIPGIVTIRDWKQILNFSTSCGANFPDRLIEEFKSFGDDIEAINNFSCDMTVKLCEKLIAAGAPEIHFYSLNHSEPLLNIVKMVGG